jgi:hypothetical protein
MALELLAAFFVAVTVGLIVWALGRWVPGMPRWIMPAAAGAALVGYTIWSEYSWFGRVSAELPAELEVVVIQDEVMPLRPWTYLAPITMRFVALDHRKTLAHPEATNLRMVTLYSFARWKPVAEGLMAVDCIGKRHVMVVDGVTISDDGTLSGADWQPATPQDKLQDAACREG